MTNHEGYIDRTADMALAKICREESDRKLKQKAMADLADIQQFAESKGWRIQGTFKLWNRESKKRVEFRDWK